MQELDRPTVSVIMFCLNRASTIRRAVESVLTNDYPRVELVVQDGQSTDGTLEILQSYGPRIKLVSEADAGSADGFRKAFKRCTGDIIASCQADEILLPDALAQAVANFRRNPRLGAVIGDTDLTDASGVVVGKAVSTDFDLIEYLFGNYSPHFCSSFFSRAALGNVGMFEDDVVFDCFEFEIWTRLATQHQIEYSPRTFARYAVHTEQLSNTAEAMLRHLRARERVIRRLFSNDGFFGSNRELRDRCLLNQYKLFYAHASTYGLFDACAELQETIRTASAGTANADFATRWLLQQNARRLWIGFGHLFPPRAKRWILEQRLHLLIRPLFIGVTRVILSRYHREPTGEGEAQRSEERGKLMICHEAATIWSGRGQIEEALGSWRRAEGLADAEIDSMACQAAQKAPSASSSDLHALQCRWAARHTNYPWVKLEVLPRRRPMRVGYHCAWWDSPTAAH
ncbi:MAG: hypothetical protein JWL84_5218, partial [Rhodospirillales bacterium]|nr:hypothetical protein [Rhodospirillales bacterium]